MLVILLSAQSVIGLLICGNISRWHLNLNDLRNTMDYSYSVKKNTSGTVDVKMGGFILDLG